MQFEGVCSGDSGGPLLERRSDGFAALVGVVSYGNADCYDRSPGIYTKVSAHARWISQVIRKAGPNRR
jgi:secreted trypsin-like serine protease